MIRKNEFEITAFNLDNKTFAVHIASLTNLSTNIHLWCRAQITFLKTDETSTTILFEYVNFASIFSSDLIAESLGYIQINFYIIELIDNKQLFYGSIISLRLIELKTLKTYIKTDSANDYMRSFKSLSSTLIFFIWLFKSLTIVCNYVLITKTLII